MEVKKLIFLAISLCIFAGSTYAQTNLSSVKGKVTLNKDSSSLSGIIVYIPNISIQAITNSSGDFKIENLKAGNYTLMASGIGFSSKSIQFNLEENEEKELNFSLTESVFNLPEVVINSNSLTGGVSGIKQLSGSGTYLSEKELKKFNYTDMNRTLRAVPGVNIQEEDGFGLFPNIGLRGSGVERSSKITIMEDGVLMAPAPYAASAAYYSPTIGRMSGVEVLKGSSQIQHGPYTTGGAINFISTPIPSQFSGNLQIMQGSFGTNLVHAHIGNSHKYFGYVVETFQNTSDGFKILDNGGNTGFNKADYLAKVRFNTSNKAKIYQSITFKVGQTSLLANETYLGLTYEDFTQSPLRRYAGSMMDNIQTNQTQYSATYAVQLNKNLNFTATGYRNDFARNWYKVSDVFNADGDKISASNLLRNPDSEGYSSALSYLKGADSPDDAFNIRANNRVYYTQGVQGVLNYKFGTQKVKHNFDLGFRVHKDEMDRFQWDDKYKMLGGQMVQTSVGEPGTQSNRIETGEAFASYIHYKLHYNKLTFSPGLRYENISISRIDYGKNNVTRNPNDANIKERSNQVEVFIPGATLNYQFNGKLRSFIGVHKGFAPPGSNEGSKAESSVNYEIGSRFYSPALAGSAVIFYNNYSNLQGSDMAAAGGAGSTDLFNAGKAFTYGLELEGAYNLLKGNSKYNLPLIFNYTFTKAEFLEDFESEHEDWGTVEKGDKIPYIAQNQFGIGITLESSLFNLNLNARYMDPVRTTAGTESIDPIERIDGFFVMDISTNIHLHNNISLFGSITNILDESYNVAIRPAGFRPAMPRMLMVGLKSKF